MTSELRALHRSTVRSKLLAFLINIFVTQSRQSYFSYPFFSPILQHPNRLLTAVDSLAYLFAVSVTFVVFPAASLGLIEECKLKIKL